MAIKSLKKHAHHLDKRLRFRLRLYLLISVILLAMLAYNVFRGALRLEYGLIGVVVGGGIGIFISRMFHISWNKDAQKVVSRLDVFGIGIIVIYVLLEIFREKIVSYFTHGTEVTTVSLAIFAGIMFGRIIGMRGKIIEVLKKQKIFS